MRRKKTFTDRRGSEILVGRKKRSLSFPELEEKGRAMNGFKKRMRRILPGSLVRRLERLRPIYLAIALVSAAALALLIWFFFFVYPSPIGGLSPAPGSHLNETSVEVKASFSRTVEPEKVELLVDGKKVEGAKIDEKSASGVVQLSNGKHEASALIRDGGLMGERNSTWQFTVDTEPPELTVSASKVTPSENEKGEVEVEFEGKTSKDATVSIGEKALEVETDGSLSGSCKASRDESLEFTAVDEAGNESHAYIVTQEPPSAKGAHVSIYIASSRSDLGKMIDMVERTELNCLEVDLKDESGQIACEVDNKLAEEIGSSSDLVNLDTCVDRMRYRDIYAICRIVVFKDPELAASKPDLAVQDKYGGPWGRGQWVDPYSRDVWDYNLSVAEAAARAGFNEIQFDYVRFPSDGDVTVCKYPSQDERNPGDVIDGFLSYARERLAPYNVFISADLFGLTASSQGEMGIGQSVQKIAQRVDYISPMVYPSHYNPGEYNIKNPEANPGDTVTKSLEDFKEAMKGTQAKLRPWLQDFSLNVTYSADMVRYQIDATEELGIDQWLLWDPDCTYTESALQPEGTQ